MMSNGGRRARRMMLAGMGIMAAVVVGCPSPPVDVLPPVPMVDPAAPASRAVAKKSAPPPGVCPCADSVEAFASDTLEAGRLPSLPRALFVPDVQYPPSERQQGWEGTLAVRILVRPDGRVARVAVGNGQDPFLMAAAKAACGSRFAPARTPSGDSVYLWRTYAFPFRLDIAIPESAPRSRR